jgi:hypothetical protein
MRDFAHLFYGLIKDPIAATRAAILETGEQQELWWRRANTDYNFSAWQRKPK